MYNNLYLRRYHFPKEENKIDYVGQKKENVKFAVTPSAFV